MNLEEGNEDRQMDLESEKVNNVVFREIIKKLELELLNPKVLPNDKKVMEAIIFIFNRHEVINIYNKNLLYHLIKERTDLQAKEITYSLTRIRSMYKDFKELFHLKIHPFFFERCDISSFFLKNRNTIEIGSGGIK